MTSMLSLLVRLQGHLCASAIAIFCDVTCSSITYCCRMMIQICDRVSGSGRDVALPAWHGPRYTTQPIYKANVGRRHELDDKAMLEQSKYPIAPETIMESAKKFMEFQFKGTEWKDMVSDDFQFVAPVVGPLERHEFLAAMDSADLDAGFPDLNPNYWGFHVDPMEPNRVWFFNRTRGTHTGTFKFGPKAVPATGRAVECPPQANSLSFDDTGKIYTLTIGYSMDRRVGNTGGLGGAFSLLYMAGSPVPVQEGHPWTPSVRYALLGRIGKVAKILSGAFSKSKAA
jgi:hypothetical protein|uniref:Uncharacterized protein n=1 Tax=Eutreptiella gymnastica TaxID=73025 RepID=A0A7S4GNJ9_9EUGL|eukprot:CAMPEP_0174293142 /NCGR_PEP_ID=MMETSP0809-20121228/37613_1 /TAXON_ID=73025 ORGANISM="Eutreptiella gymnastica-like, Strain CCMP1594" /NCGR_SAMPLE_ID=MMETSP0809 /ASSEMBLY_ACC=CAM_ASM_000658 /LENGTH=284 /DNA_ID=CAMNT_0015393707 /DNA_START=75 /DNA_END=929 /DNA_ORIENTATION=-